ncbi:hypothetical protein ACFWP7_23160 [Streptomyces sp. NPDC058470]|uniref:hypothetical protein n=1 Tax=Streptomyces sp. NPDC058470 TaxID=3346515 RepID=UPI00365A1C87
MLRPRIAVVAPLTGPRTVWGTVLLGRVDRARSACPDLAEWQVYDEIPGVADAVVGAGCTAVVGHSHAVGARSALPVYQAAGLPCFLPFVRAGAPALSWAPDEDALARTIVEGAVALGAKALSVAHDEGPAWAALAHGVGTAAAAAELALRPGGVLAVLAPQEQFERFARGGAGPVLVPVDCGLGSFGVLAGMADGREVWAVHPQMCAVRRARTAVTALVGALDADPALRGEALREAVRARSVALLDNRGGVLGDGWRVSRLGSVCPAREGG